MKTNGFGYLLREHRENGYLSLRRLAYEANLDYAYLSRLEREMNPVPRQEVVRRIAKALCYCQDLPMTDCERLQRELMDAAGMLVNDVDLLKDLRSRFADLLRNEGLSEHQSVAECAVIGIADKLKGQLPIGLIALKTGVQKDNETISKECIQMVRDKVGPVAAFKTAIVVKRLPKTRSGKILRGTVRKIADNEEYKMPATIDDPVILNEIKQDLIKKNILK